MILYHNIYFSISVEAEKCISVKIEKMWGNKMKKLIEKQTGVNKIKRRISGFWRRIIAFVVDCIILTTFGKGIEILFDSIFTQMGVGSSLLEFSIFVLYFGILNSSMGGGQTLGKRLLDIRVVNVRGRDITFMRAAIRAGILGIFFYLSAASSLVVSEELMLINSLLCVVIGWAIIYFYLFNAITRQSLHDLICSSFVVEADAEDVAVRLVIERKHYLIYSLMTVVLLMGSVYLNSMEFGNGPMSTGGLQLFSGLVSYNFYFK